MKSFLGIDLSSPLSSTEYMRRVREADPRWKSKARAEEVAKVLPASKGPDLSDVPSSVVYFVQGHGRGPVKIGVTSNLDQRMKALQTAHGEPLRLLLWVPGTEATEAMLHARFADLRVVGEWFRLEGELAKFLGAHDIYVMPSE